MRVSGQFIKSAESVQPDSSNRMNTKSTSLRSSWSPIYLKRRTILVLGAAFFLLAIAVEILQWLSDQNRGLATSNSLSSQLWSLVPTAILTILAASWARVVFQTSMAAPWIHMQSGTQDADRSVLLDYTSMLQPEALVRALRNRDWTVAFGVIIALLIQVEIILSTGLITLTPTEMTDSSFPITLTTEFGYDVSRLNETMVSAAIASRYITMGLTLANLSYPRSTDATNAYQEFEAELPGNAQLTATVAAFEADLDCEIAKMNLSCVGQLYDTDHAVETWETTMFISLASTNCAMGAQFGMTFALGEQNPLHFSRVVTGQCDQISGTNGSRVAFVTGLPNLTWTSNTTSLDGNYGEPDACGLRASSATICKPSHRLGEIGLRRDGSSTSACTNFSSSSTQDLDVDSWTIAEAVFNETAWHLVAWPVESSSSAGWRLAAVNASIDVDRRSIAIYGNEGLSNISISALSSVDYLQRILTAYYRKHTVQLVRAGLMRSSLSTSTGSLTTLQNRLLVQPLSSHSMSALLGLTGLISIGLCMAKNARSRPVTATPGSRLSNLVAVLVRSPGLLADWSSLGSKSSEEIRQLMSKANYYTMPRPDPSGGGGEVSATHIALEPHLSKTVQPNQSEIKPTQRVEKHPVALHPVSRMATCTLMLAIMISLELTLRISQKYNGLGKVRQDGYIHYLWTQLPAICFSLISLHISSIDTGVRTLVPFFHLRRVAGLDKTLGLDLLDASLPTIIYREVRIWEFAALSGTVAALLSAQVNIFTASLFTVQSVPTVHQTALYATSSLSMDAAKPSYPLYMDDYGGPESLASSLVLTKNLSYPAFTYKDLVFPEYSLSFPENFTLTNDSFTTQAVIPAARVALTCRTYNGSDIVASFTDPAPSSVRGRDLYPMNISILPELSKFQSSSLIVDTHISNTSRAKVVPFGITDLSILRVDAEDGNLLADEVDNVQASHGYSNVLFVWGSILPSRNRTIKAVAMGCNETLEVIFVNTTFTGFDLKIATAEPIEPPAATYEIPTSSTAHQTMPIMSPGMMFSYYPSTWDYEANSSSPFTNQSLFDDYMALLVARSGSTLSIDDFGYVEKYGAIMAEIQDLYGVLAAQRLNYEFRVASDRVDAVKALGNITSLPGAEGHNPPPQSGDSGPQTVVAEGELRLVQSTTLTRILQGLLGAVLGLSLLAWAARPKTNILPRDGMSIGSIGALIAGGDLEAYLASVSGPETSSQRIMGQDGTKFWLGWRTCRGKQGLEKRFGIWVIQEEWERTGRAGLT